MADLAEPTDEQLYKRVHRGDLHAFDTLYGRYEGRLLGFLFKMVRHRQDAEDLLHEALLNVLRSREVDFDRGTFCTWVYRIARNLALNHLRAGQRGHRLKLRAEPEYGRENGPAQSAEERIVAGEQAAELDRAVADLPRPLAELYRLRSAGLSYEEMAEVLQIPVGTVKSRMNHMLTLLKGEMSAWTAHGSNRS